MQFTTNVSDLQNALTTVTRAIAARSAKKILEGVLIDASADEITLTCTDTTLTIQSTIAADIQEPGRLVLPGRLFTELVRKLPQSEVSIHSNNAFSTQIKCLNSNSRLSGMNPNEFPDMADMQEGIHIRIPQNKFKDMINHVVFSTSTDESRILLTGVLMEIRRDCLQMIALDGFRLSLQSDRRDYSAIGDAELKRLVIPGRVMNELSKVLSDEETDCDIILDKSHIRAAFGNNLFASSLLQGEYMDFRRILPTEFSTKLIVRKDVLAEAIDRASLLAKEGKNNILRMQILADQINITSKADQGDVFEEISATVFGDPLEIAFNAKYISDVIRNMADDNILMKFKSNVSPCIITNSDDSDDYFYMILPVRVFN